MQKQIAEIVESVGLGDALEIVSRWGGRRLYIPKQIERYDALALTLGYNCARKLVADFGGREFELPNERNVLLEIRNKQIVAESERGYSMQAISERYGITRQMICKILRSHQTNPEKAAA